MAIVQQHISRPKRASLHTLGCRLNQAETAILEDKLRAAGYELVPFGAEADLGIINTCTVTGEADAKSRQLVRQFVRKNPHAYTAVIGCYAQMGYQTLRDIEGVDLIVGNQEKLNVLDYAALGKNGAPLIVRDRIERDDFSIVYEGDATLSRRTNLKIQDGCDFMCSFCLIPFARGRARSRDFSNLLEEAEGMARRGVKEIVLTGVNIGAYQHNGHSIVDVVDALNTVSGLARIRISSIEPATIPEALFQRMNDPEHALVPHLHIPMQSGSNKVLELMKRKYTRDEFLAVIHTARQAVPDIGIGTDVLVGSPGEEEPDFEATCELLMNSPIAYAHVFKYSERPGTAAARRQGKVDPQTKNRRAAVIRALSARKRAAYYAAHLGQQVDVLFENEMNGVWSGYTGNYIRVAARSREKEDLTNTIRPVRLETIMGDFIVGEFTGG